MGKYIIATDDNFQELINADKPVLVDFWAEWCVPCKMLGPVVEALADDVDGQAIVAKMDVDANTNIPPSLGVRSIPTILILKNGVVKEKLVGGNIPKNQLAELLLKYV